MTDDQYILFISPRSPFARRIRLVLRRLGLKFEEKSLDVFQDNPILWSANPLGTVPTLLTPDVGAISDSAHLLEYFQEKTGAIWPTPFLARTSMRQASVWCEGIMQSVVWYFQEASLHEAPSPRWLSEHWTSICDTLDHLQKLNGSIWTEPMGDFTQAGWDLVVALDYLDFRMKELDWRARHPHFLSLLERAKTIAAFRETRPTA